MGRGGVAIQIYLELGNQQYLQHLPAVSFEYLMSMFFFLHLARILILYILYKKYIHSEFQHLFIVIWHFQKILS